MKIYIVIESTKYSNNISAFKNKTDADNFEKKLLEEYSKEYNEEILDNEDLMRITFDSVYIEQYISELK